MGDAKGKKKPVQFVIDCQLPVNDNILDSEDLKKFLQDEIKVDEKIGNLGDSVTVSRDKNKVIVTPDGAFSERYLKYLTKKYLKKQQLRDFLRVVAPNKTSYELRYFNINDDNDDERNLQAADSSEYRTASSIDGEYPEALNDYFITLDTAEEEKRDLENTSIDYENAFRSACDSIQNPTMMQLPQSRDIAEMCEARTLDEGIATNPVLGLVVMKLMKASYPAFGGLDA
jgi:large subunit ribosomal protein L22e